MSIEVIEAVGASVWASYLVNGDASGLEEDEIALCDAWAERQLPGVVVDVKRHENGEAHEPEYTWSYDLYTGSDCSGGEVVTYTLHAQEESTQ